MITRPGIEHGSPTIAAGALTTELQTNASFSEVCTVTAGSYSLLQELFLQAVERWKFNVKDTL